MKTSEDYKVAAMNGTLSDDLNPLFIFNGINTELLSEFAKGNLDIDFYLRNELAKRGMDINGKWIGFKKAKLEHKLY